MESNDGEEFMPQSQSRRAEFENEGELQEQDDEFLLPEIAFLPDGYIEPQGQIVLSFQFYERSFNYKWDDTASKMVMEGNSLERK
jgi:hypothetical protein